MDSPEQNVVASAQLPKPAALQDTAQDAFATPRRVTPRSSTPRASRSTTAPSGPSRNVSLTIYENEITAFIRPVRMR